MCVCDDQFTGDGLVCTQGDCAIDNGGCSEDASCSQSGATITCECNTGFDGDGLSCVDIDECTADNGGCDENAECINVVGNRRCVCNPGFVGNGAVCEQQWTLVDSRPNTNLNPDNQGAFFASAGSSLYFAPIVGSATNADLFSYNLSDSTFVEEFLSNVVKGQFLAAGLTEVFLSDGDNLYLLGDQGNRYSPTTRQWTSIPNYNFDFQRGEAAGTTVVSGSDRFLFLAGGRSPHSASAIQMQVSTQVFSAEPGTLPMPTEYAVAHSPNGSSDVFIAGGSQSNRALYSHQFGQAAWTQQADMPESISRPIAMGEFDGSLWVVNSSGLFFFYSLQNRTWLPQRALSPPGFLNATMLDGDTYVLVQAGTELQIFKLETL